MAKAPSGIDAFRAAGFRDHAELEAEKLGTAAPKKPVLSYEAATKIIDSATAKHRAYGPSSAITHAIVETLKALGAELAP